MVITIIITTMSIEFMTLPLSPCEAFAEKALLGDVAL
jgi:hypothetical protein